MQQQGEFLLVEDDAAHVRLVQEAFLRQDSGSRITVASSIAEARKKISEASWDLVLADYLLDDGHGSDLIPEDAEAASFGVVLLTSNGDEHIAVQALKSGAVDYIVKSPETFTALPRICERAVERRQLLRERHEAELALRRSEQHLRLALLASGSAAWEFDLATGIATWSREAAELTGLPAGEQQDSGFAGYIQCVHPDDRAAVQAAWKNMIELPETADESVRVEHRITRADGSTRWIELSGRVIEPTDGVPFQLAGMLTNITGRKRADEELKLKEQELAHVARLATLGELVAGIAHELNQPLSAISNFAAAGSKLLENSDVDMTRLREWHSGIGLASSLAGGIIRRLRGLVDRRPGTRTQVDILELIQSTREILQSEERSRRVSVTVRQHGADSRVGADAIQIQQVLINLLRNAYEAIATNPVADRRVVIEVTAEDDAVWIAVSDSGPGLQIEHPERVFDSFYTTRENGLGMGLAISRSIVESHGGRLRVEAESGTGATFRFELPRRDNRTGRNSAADRCEGIAGSAVPTPHLDATVMPHTG